MKLLEIEHDFPKQTSTINSIKQVTINTFAKEIKTIKFNNSLMAKQVIILQ